MLLDVGKTCLGIGKVFLGVGMPFFSNSKVFLGVGSSPGISNNDVGRMGQRRRRRRNTPGVSPLASQRVQGGNYPTYVL